MLHKYDNKSLIYIKYDSLIFVIIIKIADLKN